jgi:hypothetical protein
MIPILFYFHIPKFWDVTMMAYRNLYYYLEGMFDGCEVSYVSRSSNEEADNLANIGSQCLPIPPDNKTSSSGKQKHSTTAGSGANKEATEDTIELEEVMMVEVTWMQPYLAYMINKTLPEDAVEARRIVRRSKAFVVVQGNLYKKSIFGVLQWCVTLQEG